MNKFDGLDIVLSESEVVETNEVVNKLEVMNLAEKQFLPVNQQVANEQNEKPKKQIKKSFFNIFATFVFCAVVAVMAAFNFASVKTFLQSEYDYSKKDILDINAIFTSVLPTSLTIKMPFAASIVETAGELKLTPFDTCTIKAGVAGVVTYVSTESDNRQISIKLQNGCVVKYCGLTYVGVKESFAVGENSPVGLADSNVTISAYLGDIRLPLTMAENGDIVWQN